MRKSTRNIFNSLKETSKKKLLALATKARIHRKEYRRHEFVQC